MPVKQQPRTVLFMGYHVRPYSRKSDALAAAKRIGAPNTVLKAIYMARIGEWCGAVQLRPDQHWMAKNVNEAGCLPLFIT